MAPPRLLEGRAVFVTGAGRGMGRGIAEALAEAGAVVAVGDLALEAVRETARVVEEQGGRVLALEIDVTRPETVEAALARTAETFGGVDGWVNNAGVLRMGAAMDAAPGDWDEQMRVNVAGLFACCQLAARHMMARGGGALVNVASNAGKVGYPNMAAY